MAMIGDNTSANVGYFKDLRTNTLKANGLTAVVDEMFTPPLSDATTLVQKVRVGTAGVLHHAFDQRAGRQAAAR